MFMPRCEFLVRSDPRAPDGDCRKILEDPKGEQRWLKWFGQPHARCKTIGIDPQVGDKSAPELGEGSKSVCPVIEFYEGDSDNYSLTYARKKLRVLRYPS